MARSEDIVRLLWVLALAILPGKVYSRQIPLKTPDDYLVKGLEDIEPAYANFEGRMYAGVVPTNDDHPDEGFMFWMFVPDRQKVDDTLVLWLNGGPGCSSFLGVLIENSPVTLGPRPPGSCCLTNDAPLKYNPFHWAKATTMLYVEQPAGVGFSTGKEPKNERDVGRDFYHFLVNFYKIFQDLQPYRLSLFGESYAGMYVPAIAHRIVKENGNDPELHINLDGIAIGNGWMDATVQGPAVIDYAWWHGMIDAYTRDAFHSQWDHCSTRDGFSVTGGTMQSTTFHPFTTPDECGIMQSILVAAGKGVLPHGLSPNTYDVTTFDPYEVVGSPDSSLAKFMNNPEVKRALNAPEGITWAGCMPGAGRRRRLGPMLDNDTPVSVVPYVAELLDATDVRVLIYNGDLDMSTNIQGSEMLLNDMKWSGHEGWKIAGRGIWILKNETVAGYVKSFSNLIFLVVKNSGHLVPFNQPAQGLELVERFLSKTSFLDIPLPSFVLSIRTAPPDGISEEDSDEFQYSLDDVSENEDTTGETKKKPFGMKRAIGQIAFAVACFLAGVFVTNIRRRRDGYQQVEDS